MSLRSRSHSATRQRSSERGNKLTKTSPSSRGVSPAATNRRVAKLNLYLQRSAKNSVEQLQGAAEPVPMLPRNSDVKRWDGNRRMTVKWDSVRRDPELWFPSGDCLIHFYERGHSRRGASLRVTLFDIESCNCGPLLDHYSPNGAPEIPTSSASSSSDSEKFSESLDNFNDPSPPAKHEIYIPAPAHLSREDAFRYHLTTRNFFAWIYEKPLVGDRLGDALIALLQRLNEWRPDEEENLDDILAYVDNEGYTDFRDCPDHALAVLQFAEKFRERELWTDAFVHCTGMWEQLDKSAEFEASPNISLHGFEASDEVLQYISRTSQALISRAHLEMDLRLERAGASLGNFLEDDLSGTYLGLGKEAQLHLERFRSFLHTFYVGKHGYWPPTALDRSSSALPKSVYRSMYFEFRNLYEYLVDPSSATAIQDNKPVDGGICVYQNILAYDRRQKYPSLPHPLPLVPKIPAQLSHGKFGRIFGNKQAKLDRRVAASDALCAATNPTDEVVMNCDLVREYLRFEKQWTMKEDTTVTCADARKVRWILVYAILQTLISVTRAPQEVRDTEGVSYALCCQIAGTPPWQTGIKVLKLKPVKEELKRLSFRETLLELGPDMDIVSAKPKPLVVVPKGARTAPNTVPVPRRVSINSNLLVKSPQPIRTSSWDVLNKGYADVSPIKPNNDIHKQLQAVSPIDHQNVSPLSHTSDPTTPSTSESGTGNGGWSASSSEDDMDHKSVTGSDGASNYGDDEDDERPAKRGSSLKLPMSKRNSYSSFRPGSHNPELDQFLRS